jgi:hypothetical protein
MSGSLPSRPQPSPPLLGGRRSGGETGRPPWTAVRHFVLTTDHIARDANERDVSVGQLEPLHFGHAQVATEKLRHVRAT